MSITPNLDPSQNQITNTPASALPLSGSPQNTEPSTPAKVATVAAETINQTNAPATPPFIVAPLLMPQFTPTFTSPQYSFTPPHHQRRPSVNELAPQSFTVQNRVVTETFTAESPSSVASSTAHLSVDQVAATVALNEALTKIDNEMNANKTKLEELRIALNGINDLNGITRELDQCKKEKVRVIENIQTLHSTILNVSGTVRKQAEDRLHALEEELPRLNSQIEDLTQQKTGAEREIQNITESQKKLKMDKRALFQSSTVQALFSNSVNDWLNSDGFRERFTENQNVEADFTAMEAAVRSFYGQNRVITSLEPGDTTYRFDHMWSTLATAIDKDLPANKFQGVKKSYVMTQCPMTPIGLEHERQINKTPTIDTYLSLLLDERASSTALAVDKKGNAIDWERVHTYWEKENFPRTITAKDGTDWEVTVGDATTPFTTTTLLGKKICIEKRMYTFTKSNPQITEQRPQYVFHGWEDCAVTAPEAIDALDQLEERDARELHLNVQAIHCSAGIGRTAVRIAKREIQDIVAQMSAEHRTVSKREVRVMTAQLTAKIRLHRAASVQTKGQYVFIYEQFKKACTAAGLLSNQSDTSTETQSASSSGAVSGQVGATSSSLTFIPPTFTPPTINRAQKQDVLIFHAPISQPTTATPQPSTQKKSTFSMGDGPD